MKNHLSRILKFMDLEFRCTTLSKGTTVFSLQCEMQSATFDYFLYLRENHAPPVLQFSIQLPLAIPDTQVGEMMLFVNLMNQQQLHEPGHWVYDPGKGTLTVVYNWYCDAQQEQFEPAFRHLFVKLIADTDDSIDSVRSLLNGLLRPEEAVSLFINRNKAWLN